MVNTIHRIVHLLVLIQFGIQLNLHRINNMKHHYNNFIYSNIVIISLIFRVDVEHQCSSEKPFSSLNVCSDIAAWNIIQNRWGIWKATLYSNICSMTKCDEMPYFLVILLDQRARNQPNLCITLTRWHAVKKEISVTGSWNKSSTINKHIILNCMKKEEGGQFFTGIQESSFSVNIGSIYNLRDLTSKVHTVVM